MSLFRAIKRDKTVAQLRNSFLTCRGGVFIYWQRGMCDNERFVVEVAIRIGRCHKKAVERNKIRRWVREALRGWIRERYNKFLGNKLQLLINVGVREKDRFNFWYIRGVLYSLLDAICSDES